MKMTFLMTALIALQTGGLSLAADNNAGGVPDYKALPCCELCPAATDKDHPPAGTPPSAWPLVAGKDGWVFRGKDDLDTDFGLKPERAAMFSEFIDALKRKGTRLMLVFTPSRGLMAPDKVSVPFDHQLALTHYQQTLAEFRKLGAMVPPLDTLVGHMKEDFFFKRDIHWTPEGARAAAGVVAETLRKDPLFAQLPDKQFVTSRTGLAPIHGSINSAVADLCHQSYPSQYARSYVTVGQASDDDLLADNTATPVAQPLVLVGTSFSALPVLNFDGFLRQSMGKDLLNMAMAGGQDRGAWLEYLPTDLFQKTPPKMVIWEMPANYSLSEKSLFRQLIPLVDNGCTDKPLIVESTHAIKPHQTHNELIFDRKLLDEKAGNLVMDMQLSDPNVHNIEVTAWYGNGNSERFRVKQNGRAKAGGRFVFLLAQDEVRGNQAFISIDLMNVDSNAPEVSLHSKVCRRIGPGIVEPAPAVKGKQHA